MLGVYSGVRSSGRHAAWAKDDRATNVWVMVTVLDLEIVVLT